MKKVDLTTGSILKKLIMVAIPALLLSLMNTLYNVVDMIYLGRVDKIGLDPVEAITGVGIGGFYIWLAFGFILLSRMGTSVFVAQKIGEKKADEVSKVQINGIVTALICGLIYGIVIFFSAKLLVEFYNYNANTKRYAVEYLKIWSFCFPIYFAKNTISGIFNGQGKSMVTFFAASVGILLNVIIDPIFIFNLNLGVKGAAYATLISQIVSLLIYVYLLNSRFNQYKLKLKDISFKYIKKIVKISLLPSIQSMLFTMFAIVISFKISDFGETAGAVGKVGSQIESICWMVAGGFQVAISAFVGQNYGAKQFDRIKKGFVTSQIIVVSYALIVSAIMYIFAEEIFSIFIQDPKSIEMGAVYLRIISFSQLFMMVEIAISGAYFGFGKPIYPSIVGILFNFLRIPLIFILSPTYGINSVWMIYTFTSIFKGLFVFVGYFYLQSKVMKKEEAIR